MTSYAAAGVSIAEGDRAVELMKQWVDKARRPEVVGGIVVRVGDDVIDGSVSSRLEQARRAVSA